MPLQIGSLLFPILLLSPVLYNLNWMCPWTNFHVFKFWKEKREAVIYSAFSCGTLHRDVWQKKINLCYSPLYIEGIVNFQDIRFNKCLVLYLNICVTFYTSYLLMIQSTSSCHPNLGNGLNSQFLLH